MLTTTANQVGRRFGRASSALAWVVSAVIVVLLTSNPVRAQAVVQPPGRLIDVGGYHMHLWCAGPASSGHPTVVLSSGAGGFALDWALVQPAISEATRVCSYDDW
ncbi:MAG TPA: hypothetical protein VFZ56_01170 [Gemmatimonadaceae bacterium]